MSGLLSAAAATTGDPGQKSFGFFLAGSLMGLAVAGGGALALTYYTRGGLNMNRHGGSTEYDNERATSPSQFPRGNGGGGGGGARRHHGGNHQHPHHNSGSHQDQTNEGSRPGRHQGGHQKHGNGGHHHRSKPNTTTRHLMAESDESDSDDLGGSGGGGGGGGVGKLKLNVGALGALGFSEHDASLDSNLNNTAYDSQVIPKP